MGKMGVPQAFPSVTKVIKGIPFGQGNIADYALCCCGGSGGAGRNRFPPTG
jgi:hypothetical protein